MMLKKSIVLILLLWSFKLAAQQTYSISGTVKSNGVAVSGAQILLGGYKISTRSDDNGKFSISNLPAGNYDILVQLMGYFPLSKNVVLTDHSVTIDLALKENVTILKEVEIKPNPNRAYYINFFKTSFIGTTPNSKNCKLINPEVLIIDEEIDRNSVKISANDFLIIENEALGYRIKYLLDAFEYSFKSRMLYYAGIPSFEEMTGSTSQKKRWAKNREIAYRGSAVHFFKSLYENRVDENGFLLYKRVELTNPNRLSDSVLKANYRALTKYDPKTKTYRLNTQNNPQYNLWKKQNSEPRKLLTINRSKILTDTLAKPIFDNMKVMNYTDELFIVYKHEKETDEYENGSFFQNRPPDLKRLQVSAVKILTGPIYFYSNGGVYNPRSTIFSGVWAYEKMADFVPMDYVPISK